MRASTKAAYDKRYARHAPARKCKRQTVRIDYTVNVPKWSREQFLGMWPVRFCGRMTNGKYMT